MKRRPTPVGAKEYASRYTVRSDRAMAWSMRGYACVPPSSNATDSGAVTAWTSTTRAALGVGDSPISCPLGVVASSRRPSSRPGRSQPKVVPCAARATAWASIVAASLASAAALLAASLFPSACMSLTASFGVRWPARLVRPPPKPQPSATPDTTDPGSLGCRHLD